MKLSMPHTSLYRSTIRRATSLVLCLFVATLTGCGSSSDGPEMVTTQGEVTWKGQPVETGRVIFRLLDGDRRGFSAPIEGGKFEIETYPGQVRVEIRASRLVPGKFDNSNDEPEPMGEMYIPAQFNTQSTLVLNVPADEATEFNLDG